MNAQAEAMGASDKGKGASTPVTTGNELVFRPNNGGVNYGPLPMGDLTKLGLEM